MASVGRGLASPLLTINFILAVVGACLAGWALNRNFDCAMRVGEGCVGNGITSVFLPLALIACVVTIAAKFAGTHHLRVWRTDSLAAAAATALIALLLTFLALGVAIKEIKVGGYRPKRLKALEAIIIILGFFEILYTMSLHAGVLGDKYGPTYA
ncbi:hypothetical protein M758_2G218400 [Ceratodon purpureus]|nr:hypothetical protein M758_2G218400 [Ceratodon purpureus]